MKLDRSTIRITVIAVAVIVLAFFAAIVALEETGRGADARVIVGYFLTAGTGIGTIGTVAVWVRNTLRNVEDLHAELKNGLIERPVRRAIQDVISPRPSELRTRVDDPSPPVIPGPTAGGVNDG